MICAADTVGVFQIESRAQMSMLPRLRPRCFYDLVIEVAIVRPGPIQGGMVHPYLRRRHGLEPVTYPSEAVRRVLEKTLGVPLFQEQVMRLAVVAAGFTPGEADQLRRAMAAWRRGGQIEKFRLKLIRGLLARGYSRQFAEQIYRQIQGFGEYGFPESHAASFALLVYASAWLKRHCPAAFCAALLNSQPLGFYSPGQLIRDAIAHGVPVCGVDVCFSEWDCTLEKEDPDAPSPDSPTLRLGLRLVRGLSEEKVRALLAVRREMSAPPTRVSLVPSSLSRGDGSEPGAKIASPLPRLSIHRLARAGVPRDTLLRLAAADAFRSLGLNRRQALWQILRLDRDAGAAGAGRTPSLFAALEPDEPPVELPPTPIDETVVQDYDSLGFSLNAHPIGLIRNELDALSRAGRSTLRVIRSQELQAIRNGQRVAVAGLVTCRQRPGTAGGIVFMTLEDETGMANLIVRPRIFDRDWQAARTCTALLAEGLVERQGQVVHVMARRLLDLAEVLAHRRPTPPPEHERPSTGPPPCETRGSRCGCPPDGGEAPHRKAEAQDAPDRVAPGAIVRSIGRDRTTRLRHTSRDFH